MMTKRDTQQTSVPMSQMITTIDGLRPPLAPVRLPELPPQPLVSVLITSFNYSRFIGATIESVLDQTYHNLEVIICDDASSDDSCSVIEQYVQRDPRVRLIRRPQNGGMAAATNDAYAASSGKIICLLDSDDIFDPVKIERVVNQFLALPNVGLVIHAMNVVDQTGSHIQQIPYLTAFEHGWIAERVIQRGGRWRDMPTSALCFRRELAEFAFPIPEASFRRGAHDGFIFTLLPLLTEVSAIDEPLSNYRVHGQNTFAARQSTLTKAIARTNFVTRQVDAVNQRLNAIGITTSSLDISRNLEYQQSSFLLALFKSTPRRRLVRAYMGLMAALFADDLYRRPQKLLGLIVYGGAILLPLRIRPRWLDMTLGYNTAKPKLRRIITEVSSMRVRKRRTTVGITGEPSDVRA